MFEWYGPFQRADNIDLLLLGPADPVGEGQCIWHGRAQHDYVDVVWQEDQHLHWVVFIIILFMEPYGKNCGTFNFGSRLTI